MGTAASRYVDALARRYAIATSSYAITHPSLPNYLALTSGSTQGSRPTARTATSPGATSSTSSRRRT